MPAVSFIILYSDLLKFNLVSKWGLSEDIQDNLKEFAQSVSVDDICYLKIVMPLQYCLTNRYSEYLAKVIKILSAFKINIGFRKIKLEFNDEFVDECSIQIYRV